MSLHLFIPKRGANVILSSWQKLMFGQNKFKTLNLVAYLLSEPQRLNSKHGILIFFFIALRNGFQMGFHFNGFPPLWLIHGCTYNTHIQAQLVLQCTIYLNTYKSFKNTKASLCAFTVTKVIKVVLKKLLHPFDKTGKCCLV